jgi:ParB family chromosome partitioning protein
LGKRGLGRGLNALIAGTQAGDVARSVRELRIESVAPNPFQTRTRFDESALRELADSIREHGVLQPVLVRRRGPDRYEIIVGERRLRASKLAGHSTIPAVVRECSDRDMLLLALIENVQREDVSPVEQARAYRRMAGEFGLTQEDIAQRVGKSRSAVGNTMRLLALPEAALEALDAGKITEGHARLLVPLEPGMAEAALLAFIERNMSVREAEAVVRALARGEGTGRRSRGTGPSSANPNLAALAESLSLSLGTKVSVQHRPDATGVVLIEYYSDEQLEGIVERITAGR